MPARCGSIYNLMDYGGRLVSVCTLYMYKYNYLIDPSPYMTCHVIFERTVVSDTYLVVACYYIYKYKKEDSSWFQLSISKLQLPDV